MKWMFFLLLIVNLSLLGVFLLKQRDAGVQQVYQESEKSGRIVLLSEEASGQGALRCLMLGPASDKEEAEKWHVAYEKNAIESSVVVKDIEVAPSYWVIGSVGSSEVGANKVSELKGKGFDSYVINSGEYKGSISLGVFDNVDLARRLKKRLLKVGFESSIKEKRRVLNEYWLKIPQAKGAEYKEKVSQIAVQLNNSKKIREIFCKSVASENKFP